MRDSEAFATALRAARRASGTIDQRLGDLRRFEQTMHVDPADATVEDLRSYLAEGAATWAAEYMRRIRTTFRVYYSWLAEQGERYDNPGRRLAAIQVPHESPRSAAPEEIVAAALRSAQTTRDRLILVLAAVMGLRRTEIATLPLQARQGDILTVTGKGGVTRKLPLDETTLTLMRTRERELTWAEYYYPGRYERHVHPSTIASWARPHLNGWPLHSLRHRAASRAYQVTHDIRAIQKFLGHASLETTQRYADNDPAALAAITAATSVPLDDPPVPGRANKPSRSSTTSSDDLASLIEAIRTVEPRLRKHGLMINITPVESAPM